MSDHVWLNGKRHEVIDLDSFDRLAWPSEVINLPVGAGWVTTAVGSARFAAWLPAQAEGKAS